MGARSVCEDNSLLVIDAGNTRIKWTLFKHGIPLHKWYSEAVNTADEVKIQHIAYASVRSQEHDDVFLKVLKQHYPNSKIYVLVSEAQACGLINSYEEPHRLGIDRWLTAIAAFKEYPLPVVIVDAGTAIKADFVSADGVHLGGYIVPGIELMKTSLLGNTAKIRFTENEVSDDDVIPHSTADAVSMGCLEMAYGFLERLYKRHSDATWVVTGGAGEALMSHLGMTYIKDEHLVAKGAMHLVSSDMAERAK